MNNTKLQVISSAYLANRFKLKKYRSNINNFLLNVELEEMREFTAALVERIDTNYINLVVDHVFPQGFPIIERQYGENYQRLVDDDDH